MTGEKNSEGFPPAANNPPGSSMAGTILFFIRSLLDMQMGSVYRHLRPWLQERGGALLEVGCGAQPYRHLVPANCQYTGLDWEQAGELFEYHIPDTVYYDGGLFPFEDDSFDNLFHTEVLEHVYLSGQFLTECRRVLKPSGAMFFTVPFQARYHYKPHDFFRYTPAALERMLGEAGFRQIEIRPRGSDITVAAYKGMSVLYRWLLSGIAGKIAFAVLFPLALPLLMAGWLSYYFSIGSSDDCLGYTVTARN
jgi:SAM-dependent methyltransferase